MKMKVPPRAYVKLKELGDEVMGQIDGKLTAGESCGSVTHWLQVDRKLLVDMRHDNLTRMLERYRGSELRNKVIARITEAATGDSIKTVEKRVNAMTELEEMARIQRARVDKMLGLEDGKPMLIKATSDEIRLLKDMLSDLVRVQVETGFLTRAPRTIKGVMANAKGETVAWSWTEEHDQLLQELKLVGSSAAGE